MEELPADRRHRRSRRIGQFLSFALWIVIAVEAVSPGTPSFDDSKWGRLLWVVDQNWIIFSAVATVAFLFMIYGYGPGFLWPENKPDRKAANHGRR